MNLLLRLLWVLAAARGRKPLGLLDTSQLRLRVLPNDIDIYGHMNNGRYLSIMDLGRIDHMARTGFYALSAQRRWSPLVGAIRMRYRRPLNLGEPYVLRTHVLGWDPKWIFMEQRFESKRHGLAAVGWVKGLFRGPNGKVPTRDLLAGLKADYPDERLPEALRDWIGPAQRP